MKIYIDGLISWAEKLGIELSIELYSAKANQRSTYKDLSILHKDYSKIRVLYKYAKCNGGIRITSLDSIVKNNNGHTNHGYSDSSVVNSGFDKEWWIANLKTFRSLYQFHFEGNGDGLYLNTSTGQIFFLAHDWMDWISSEPPMFKVSNSIDELYNEWSTINFSWPHDLYWMNTCKGGRFVGFTKEGFTIIE